MDHALTTLRRLRTTEISDALDRLGISGHCLGVMPLDRRFTLVGRAFTVRYGPVGIDGGTVGDYLDDVNEGGVVVLDNGGRLDATVWGDLLTSAAHRAGVAGTVIDGVCRDVVRSFELGYPVFARGNWMRTGKDRVRVEEVGGSVNVGGARVRAGDYLVGDADGVVVLPAERASEVIDVAAMIGEREEQIRVAIEGGARLREARQQAGYHSLQSPDRR